VILNKSEVFEAAMVGVMRHCKNLTRPDAYGFQGDGWGVHIAGAMGEKVVAKYLDRYWSAVVDNPWALDGDVGSHLQVRTKPQKRSRDPWLTLHPKDKDEDVFVLVCGDAPVFELAGWIRGSEGKDQKWWSDPQQTQRYAFFVPASQLHPMDEFLSVV